MKKTTTTVPQTPSESFAKAVELASLVWDILIGTGPETYKKKIQQTNPSRELLRTFSSIRKNKALPNKEIPTEKMSLEDMLGSSLSSNEWEKIQELASDPEVMKIYAQEYSQRKDNFDLLARGQKELPQVLSQEAIIQQAKQRILDMRIQAFREHKKLTPVQIAYIHKIQEMIDQKWQEIQNMLSKREVATAYRLHQLQAYKKQLDTTWFMITPSRQENIDEIIEKILLGQNVLLTGPTGTGKTVLALQAVRTIASGKTIDISWKSLSEEIMHTAETTKILDDFEYVLSGHAWITPSEFIAKIALKWDGQWGTQTYSQLWKILKAFVEWAIPIIDEIDLIPNDVMMRVKHLFTLKPGNDYIPQEDNNQRYTIQSRNLIATANIKSAKHTDRQELDPAIVRLFKGIEIKYLPKDETYDLALANIMQPQWFAYGVDVPSLWDKNGILYLLIESLKEIENNYLGKNDGEKISNKSWVYLSKAVLELGNFIDLFKGFQESGQDFTSYIKQKVLQFVSNGAYPKSDRLILIKMFSAKWLIVKKDIQSLEQRMSDISEDELKQNIINEDFEFTHGAISFVDPYELANLDPDTIRDLSSLELDDKTSKIRETIKAISADLMKINDQEVDTLMEVCDEVLIAYEKDKEFMPSQPQIKNLLGWLYEKWLSQYIVSCEWLSPQRDEIIERIMLFDRIDPQGKKYFSERKDKETINVSQKKEKWKEHKEKIEQQCVEYLLNNNKKTVAKIKTTNSIEVEWWDIDLNLTRDQLNGLSYLQESDIQIQKSENKNIVIDGKQETFATIHLLIRGIEYTALQIPQGIKDKPLKNLIVGKRLLAHADNDWFPNMDFSQKTPKDWIIMTTANMKDKAGDLLTDIPTQDTSKSEDVVRLCALQWMKPITITDTIVLWEIIKYGMGDEYVDFIGHNADNDEQWYPEIRKKIAEIEKYTGFVFNEYDKDDDGQDKYIIRNWGIYKNKQGNPQAFLRGRFNSDCGALGGVCSVSLGWGLDYTHSRYGFRSLE